MLVSELREHLKHCEKDELAFLVVELYKTLPKKLRLDQDVDALIQGAKDRMGAGKAKKAQDSPADVQALKPEIELFLANAYKQNYLAPNRSVPKQERPKWRFKVKGYIKALQTVPSEGETGRTAADLMEKLYAMLCYGCCYYIFNTEDPFRSVGIAQTDALDWVIAKRFACAMDREAIKAMVQLTVAPGVDRQTLHSSLLCVLIANLKTADAKMIALEEAKAQVQALKEKGLDVGAKKSLSGFASYEHKERINLLTELVFRLNMALCEYEAGIYYFKVNVQEGNREIALYLLLALLFEYGLKDEWLKAYRTAVHRGIEPRKQLQAVYEQVQAHDALPERFW